MSRYAVIRGSVGVAVLAVFAAVAAVFAIHSENWPAAKAVGCADVDVSFARGTNDSPGLGDVGQAFVDTLTERLPDQRVDVYAVDYPASFDFVRAGEGSNDLSDHIQQVARACPDTQFVLGGYSQGGAVVGVLMGDNPTGLTYDNPLPPELDQRIAAIAVFGYPKRWQVNGIDLDLSIRPDLRDKVIDLCNPGDMICHTDGGGMGPHTAYRTDGSADRAVDFVITRLAEATASSSASSSATTSSTGTSPTGTSPTGTSPTGTSPTGTMTTGSSPTTTTPTTTGTTTSPTTSAPIAPTRHGPPTDLATDQ
jgi:cutinase